MGFARRTLKFGGGLVLGAAVSTAVSVLLAPQSGPELQGAISDRSEEARRAGEEAEILETERLKRQFRVAVNDPTALTGKFDRPGAATQISPTAMGMPPADDKARREAAKARQDAERARQKADRAEDDIAKARQKADDQVRKAEEQAAKADADADKREREAAKARAAADKATRA